MQDKSTQTGAEVIRGDDLTGYTPPRHTGTVNHRLLDASLTHDAFNVVHGAIEHGGEAEEHYHQKSSQFLHILSGSCVITLGQELEHLHAGDSVFIPAGIRHHVEVIDPEGITLINVYQPALDPNDILASPVA